jgi:hypothetical protein
MANHASKLQKKDNGLLHILHKKIVFLADPNYQVKIYAGPIFGLGRTQKATSECTTTDAERLKHNMGYAIL